MVGEQTIIQTLVTHCDVSLLSSSLPLFHLTLYLFQCTPSLCGILHVVMREHVTQKKGGAQRELLTCRSEVHGSRSACQKICPTLNNSSPSLFDLSDRTLFHSLSPSISISLSSLLPSPTSLPHSVPFSASISLPSIVTRFLSLSFSCDGKDYVHY